MMKKEKNIGVTFIEAASHPCQKIPYTYNRFFRQYRSQSEGLAHHILLESGRGGRYSIAAFEPDAILTGKNSELEIVRDGEKQVLEGNPFT